MGLCFGNFSLNIASSRTYLKQLYNDTMVQLYNGFQLYNGTMVQLYNGFPIF